jgi:hypothetical protein
MTYHILKQTPLLSSIKSLLSSQQNAQIWGKAKQITYRLYPGSPVQKYMGMIYIHHAAFDPIDGDHIRALFIPEGGINSICGLIEQAVAEEIYMRIHQLSHDQSETTTLPVYDFHSNSTPKLDPIKIEPPKHKLEVKHSPAPAQISNSPKVYQEIVDKKPLPLRIKESTSSQEEETIDDVLPSTPPASTNKPISPKQSFLDGTEDQTLEFEPPQLTHATLPQVDSLVNPFAPKKDITPNNQSNQLWQQIQQQPKTPSLNPNYTPANTLPQSNQDFECSVFDMRPGDEVIHQKYGKCQIQHILKGKIILNANTNAPVELDPNFFNIYQIVGLLPKRVFRVNLK